MNTTKNTAARQTAYEASIVRLHQEIAAAGQKATYKETLRATVNGKTFALRIRIESDSYKFQCVARAEIFSTVSNSWNQIASIVPENMKTEKGLSYARDNGWKNAALYRADADNLVQQALAILEVAYA